MWMVSNYLSDKGINTLSIRVMGLGILLGVFYLIFVFIKKMFKILQPSLKFLSVPIIFTELKDSEKSSSMFNNFCNSNEDLIATFKEVEDKSKLGSKDLIISFNHSNPRNSFDAKDWASAINELLWEWEKIDKKLMEPPFANKDHCYHLVPHIPLPLAFSLGAAVNKRRRIVLYYPQKFNNEKEGNIKYYAVMDLSNPNKIFEKPDPDFFSGKNISMESIPENLDNLLGGEKLILHIAIVPIHSQNFQIHPDYRNADNAALIYQTLLEPTDDWLPYVQQIVQKVDPLISRYHNVEICLRCPDVIAFALGIAFSRNPGLKVCTLCDDKTYRPVFSLSEIEHKLPFS